jgi:enoyl-CoA hydratase/carnithine racemase
MRLERRETTFVLCLGEGENRLDGALLADLDAALDEVEAAPGDPGLVTCGAGGFYSNGYDLDWLGALPVADQRSVVADHQALLARLVLFPRPTAAAINGHAIGGGALLALAHDFRTMRADRGFFCLPEIDARIPFRPGMIALLERRLAPEVCRDLVLGGAKIPGEGACARRVVDEAVAADAVVERAIARVTDLVAKQRLYGDVAEALRSGSP